ncbi:uncharacterized protein A1O9_07954 [Exophiala aquamarina CBS 119918]|uniref:DSBA-like thioredoxin domain-containing protein n=1 Tax=Exophiala aquamarina CBS 119918 TaxID=1182545 RepID=A0A072PAT6_9EURO|nr:uncharacterized protein A1O9_07954 [Exophiala aquamarina CBS 119918]KEF56373.1 hypothetical protein A1O9_07954 [Exophiala aquamarina CBS 119918]
MIYDVFGNADRGRAKLPDKVAWMTTDLTRWANQYHIPWKPGWPENYPFRATTLKVSSSVVRRTCRAGFVSGVARSHVQLTSCYCSTYKVQRVLAATALDYPDRYPEAISALYHAFWAQKKGVQLPEVHYPIVVGMLGEERAKKVLQRSSSDEIKARLKQNTETAIANGCPGLPWIVATSVEGQKEKFWGFDHLGQVASFLGLERVAGPHL